MSYADQHNVAGKYGAAATRYSDAYQSEDGEIAHAVLEKEIVRRLLGDCTGLNILDIAGGSGNHARQASELGAAHVDVVDISAGFMEVGKQIEARAGRNTIGWHLADAYRPLEEQVPALKIGGYDVVLAIWALDHVANLGQLEELWRNISTYLKPNGRVVGIRVANAKAESAREPKYGVKYHSHQPIENGLSYAFTLYTKPPFTVEASSMESSYSGSTDLAEKAGITNVKLFSLEDANTVKANPEFWDLLVRDPFFVAFTAEKQ